MHYAPIRTTLLIAEDDSNLVYDDIMHVPITLLKLPIMLWSIPQILAYYVPIMLQNSKVK